MLDAYYSNSRTIWRFRNCGMLGDYMDGFADYLEGKQFSRSTAREYLRAARHLSIFAFSTGATEIGELSTELIDAFVNDHLPVCTCERMNGGKFEGTVAAMSYLVDFLSAQGAVNVVRRQFPAPPLPLHVDRSRDSGARPSVEEIPLYRKPAQERRQAAIAALPSQTGQALIRYDEYLKRLFGLTDKTREMHRSKMLFFIQWLVQTRGSGFGLSELTTTEIIEFQNVCNGDGFSYDYRRSMMSCLRGFLRFLKWEGVLVDDLTVAVYPLIRWKKSEVPRYIPEESVRVLLDAVDRTSMLGARDYLMMVLLIELGIRACEIVGIRLDDISLAKGELLIRGSKTRRERRLPLSEGAADAIVCYLRLRPTVPGERRLFLSSKAPYGPLISPSTVGIMVRRYIEQTGIDAPFKGSHLLRHSLATHLVNHDVTIKTTSDILGHLDLDTTSIYAKVDIVHLREIALPLPKTWRKVGV